MIEQQIKDFKNSEQPSSAKGEVDSKEGKLICDFMNGDPIAFRVIYQKFKDPILKLISYRIKDLQVAEELVQEVFMRVFRFRGQYNPEYEFSTWLWAVARNVTIDHLSRCQSDPLFSRPHHEYGLELTDVACNTGTAEVLYLKKSERRDLFQLLRKLPKLQRKAILLRVIKGCSYLEIAGSLQLSLSAVKSLIHRGKVSLQSLGYFLNTTDA